MIIRVATTRFSALFIVHALLFVHVLLFIHRDSGDFPSSLGGFLELQVQCVVD